MRENAGMLTGFFAGDKLAALVVATLATHAMREFALVAVRALGGTDRGEEVVGAALGGTLLGVAAFGIRHCRFLSKAGLRKLVALRLVAGARENSFI